MHPPFPSVVKPLGHDGEEEIVTGVFVDGRTGTQPPYPSVSHPEAHD